MLAARGSPSRLSDWRTVVDASAWGSPLHSTRHDGAVPLQETHAEADAAAPEPATAEVAPAGAEVAPAADNDGLVAEVTPAAVDSTAAAGEPIAEAVVALQEVMEPAPVPEPVLEGESSRPCSCD